MKYEEYILRSVRRNERIFRYSGKSNILIAAVAFIFAFICALLTHSIFLTVVCSLMVLGAWFAIPGLKKKDDISSEAVKEIEEAIAKGQFNEDELSYTAAQAISMVCKRPEDARKGMIRLYILTGLCLAGSMVLAVNAVSCFTEVGSVLLLVLLGLPAIIFMALSLWCGKYAVSYHSDYRYLKELESE